MTDTARPGSIKFAYTIFYVPSVEEAVLFYERAFGLQRGFVHEEGSYGELQTGETRIAFASEPQALSNGIDFMPRFPGARAPAMEIGFYCHDIEAAYHRAIDAGARSVSEPQAKPWGQTVAYVRDLNGFLIELCSNTNEQPS